MFKKNAVREDPAQEVSERNKHLDKKPFVKYPSQESGFVLPMS